MVCPIKIVSLPMIVKYTIPTNIISPAQLDFAFNEIFAGASAASDYKFDSELNRLCRRLTGCTAFELIQQRLVLEARRRLVYAGSSVSAIAAELGFKDPAYFSRFFRRHGGLSPNEFRRRHHGG